MIKVLFAPGTYGTFLSKCIYYFSDLSNQASPMSFNFDHTGSSHDFRDVDEAKSIIKYGHINALHINYQVDSVITLIPNTEHFLDYYNNQYIKEAQNHTISYIRSYFSPDEIKATLREHWNFTEPFDHNVPEWILREWTSFWINDILQESYSPTKYQNISSLAQYDVNEIFNDLYLLLEKITQVLDLKILIPKIEIEKIQNQFILHQKLHGIQKKCKDWVLSIIQKKNNIASPCSTIFDEAYVQFLLKNNGYEIQCQNLNVFPVTSTEMIKIIHRI